MASFFLLVFFGFNPIRERAAGAERRGDRVPANQNEGYLVSDLVCGDLLLGDPAHGVLEVPSRLIPGPPAAPPVAPPPVEGACDGLMDPLQLVLAHLQPADRQTGSAPAVHQVKKSDGERSRPHVLTMLSLGCPCCLRSTARAFSCSMVSLAIAM